MLIKLYWKTVMPHCSTYYYGCFHITKAELSSCYRERMVLNYLLSVVLWKICSILLYNSALDLFAISLLGTAYDNILLTVKFQVPLNLKLAYISHSQFMNAKKILTILT